MIRFKPFKSFEQRAENWAPSGLWKKNMLMSAGLCSVLERIMGFGRTCRGIFCLTGGTGKQPPRLHQLSVAHLAFQNGKSTVCMRLNCRSRFTSRTVKITSKCRQSKHRWDAVKIPVLKVYIRPVSDSTGGFMREMVGISSSSCCFKGFLTRRDQQRVTASTKTSFYY